jgi:hypothetical protein
VARGVGPGRGHRPRAGGRHAEAFLSLLARTAGRGAYAASSTNGADPNLKDERGRTPLDLSRPANRYLDNPGHAEVDAILRPLTAP